MVTAGNCPKTMACLAFFGGAVSHAFVGLVVFPHKCRTYKTKWAYDATTNTIWLPSASRPTCVERERSLACLAWDPTRVRNVRLDFFF